MAILASIPLKVDAQAFLAAARASVDEVLQAIANECRLMADQDVGQAIAYSLEGPGKRLRPALVQAVFAETGGVGDVTGIAAAVEIVHTYSLVHDDLPCMDDDDLRRGRPTAHKQFGVPTATRAGFEMVTLAARTLGRGSETLGLSNRQLCELGRELFRSAGAGGMVGGQVADLAAEGRATTLDELRDIHRRKTGALITASAVMGALAAGCSSPIVAAIRGYGREIGVAFQIADDVLDATASSEQLGKTAGKDAIQQKATFATLLGVDRAMAEAQEHSQNAIDQLGAGGVNSLLLKELAHFIVYRRS